MSSARHTSKAIPIGWIGGGSAPVESDRVSRFHRAIAQQSRGLVVAVFADCREAADSLAGLCGGQLHRSLRSFCQDTRLQAILCLDLGWLGLWGLERLRLPEVPVLVANPLASPFSQTVLEQLAAAERDGCPFIPAAVWRMTPATLRLRELLATQLGSVRCIEVTLRSPRPQSEALLEAIDWCRTLLVAGRGELCATTPTDHEVFKGITRGGAEPPVEVVIQHTTTPVDSEPTSAELPPAFEAQVTTSKGSVTVRGEDQLAWTLGTESATECLKADRTAEQVMLDLFLRRVVGGLVPAPSWDDLHRVASIGSQSRGA